MAGISKSFGEVVANDDVSFEVERGEIHALLGENGAGKTTLMNIVFGLVEADAGEIRLDGERVEIASPRAALDLGIGMVHQHFKLVPDMTVAENVALTSGRRDLGPLGLAEVRGRVGELSHRFGLEVDPDAVIEELSVGARQRVEIIKMLDRGARILILDEPTGVLTPREWEGLATVLRSLAAEGRSIVFITHKLQEVFAVARRCTVLRDGAVVATRVLGETSTKELATMMIGRDVSQRISRARSVPGARALELRGVGLSDGERDLLSNIDLTVAEREIVGIAGVDGNGQRELVETIIGALRPSAGEVVVCGTSLEGSTPAGFLAAGGAVIPEDRQRTGLAIGLSVTENLVLKDFDRPPYASHGIVDAARMRARGEELIAAYDIRAARPQAPIRGLSGGNQQKTVLARELGRRPRVLIASQPTRGLDVGAVEFVHRRLVEFSEAGGAVLLISTELEEILALSDRIAVMVGGRFRRVLDADQATTEVLGMLMAGESATAGSETEQA
ncbi:MAG: ABC transporter ATP-binding protein [Solirubrobacterales bacterium]